MPEGKKHVLTRSSLFVFLWYLSLYWAVDRAEAGKKPQESQSKGTTSSRGGIKGKVEESTGMHVRHTTGFYLFPAIVLNCDHLP